MAASGWQYPCARRTTANENELQKPWNIAVEPITGLALIAAVVGWWREKEEDCLAWEDLLVPINQSRRPAPWPLWFHGWLFLSGPCSVFISGGTGDASED